MRIPNKPMLITYANSMGGNLSELHNLLNKHFATAVGSVHILPFFPSSADRGFAPLQYDQVDSDFGSYEDIRSLSNDYALMFDFMVNHISAQSAFFKDFLAKKEQSQWKDLFLRYSKFWPNGEPTQSQVDLIYKRKPRDPYIEAEFANNTTEKIWCTFSTEQIDLDVSTETTRRFIADNIQFMCDNGALMIRLDAFAYAVKKPDTNCFFIEPEIWGLLESIKHCANENNVEILPEIHEHYSIQQKLANKGYWVYDFALPMLVLHALHFGRGEYLKHWLEICPRTQFTTLDTHDGIGVVDVADLLPKEEIEATREKLYSRGANVKKVYSSAEYNNLDIYQINCTYYSALGDNDDAYLIARAIQMFAPGIPQVYYVGMLVGKNDIGLLEETREGRDINRHHYTSEEVVTELQRPVVQKLLSLMKLRAEHPAFDWQGECIVECKDNLLCIRRQVGEHWAEFNADLRLHTIKIAYSPWN